MHPIRIILGMTFIAAGIGAAQAEEKTVKMLNNGPDGPMAFDPSFVTIAPGDSVKFVATDKSHNVATIKGMAPEGAPEVKGRPNKDETVTFEKEGVYGFKCEPHYSMGMVALVVVGSKLDNLDQAKSAQLSPAAKKRFDPLFAQAQK